MNDIESALINKIELESKIQAIIEEDNHSNNTVHFYYEESAEHGVDLSIITHNPVHNTNFLFHKSWGVTEELALQNALQYLSTHRNTENSYTVEWSETDKKLTTSYFTGRDPFAVLNKFYHGKNPNKFQIFLIKLNPIS